MLDSKKDKAIRELRLAKFCTNPFGVLPKTSTDELMICAHNHIAEALKLLGYMEESNA